MGAKIRGFAIEPIQKWGSRLGRKGETESAIVLKTTGGSVFLPKSAVTGAGDDWEKLTERLRQTAREKHIPFEETESINMKD